MTEDVVAHWRRSLRTRVGMSEREIEASYDALMTFCRHHATTPAQLVQTWRQFPELTVRRRRDDTVTAPLAVESFLIHNGVNVLGEIACVAARAEDLAEQGARFLRALPDDSRVPA